METTMLGALLEKIAELVGEKLLTALTSRRLKHRRALLSLFSLFGKIDLLIGAIIDDVTIAEDVFPINERAGSDEPAAYRRAEERIEKNLFEVQRLLKRVGADLKTLSPEFEIMANDAARMADLTYAYPMSVVANLLFKPLSLGPDDYASLVEVRNKAEKTREAIRDFVTKAYDWQTLHE